MELDPAFIDAIKPLRYEDFQSYLNHTFKTQRFGDEMVCLSLELTEVKHLGASPLKGHRDHFILIFREPSGQRREQAMCLLEHPDQGVITLFLIPYSQDEQGIYYQSVFS
jgi:hypothetical protein